MIGIFILPVQLLYSVAFARCLKSVENRVGVKEIEVGDIGYVKSLFHFAE